MVQKRVSFLILLATTVVAWTGKDSPAIGSQVTESNERFTKVQSWRLRVIWRCDGSYEIQEVPPYMTDTVSIKKSSQSLNAKVDFRLAKLPGKTPKLPWKVQELTISETAKGENPQGKIAYVQRMQYCSVYKGKSECHSDSLDISGIREGHGRVVIAPRQGIFDLEARVTTPLGTMRRDDGGAVPYGAAIDLTTMLLPVPSLPVHNSRPGAMTSRWQGLLPAAGYRIVGRRKEILGVGCAKGEDKDDLIPVSISFVLEPWENAKSDCDVVRGTINEQKRLREAFGDKSACRKFSDGWSFRRWAYARALGVKNGDAGAGEAAEAEQGKDYSSPMATNPYTCGRIENPGWERDGDNRIGEPDILYESDAAHEDVHRSHCQNPKEFFKVSLPYATTMANEPCLHGDDEVAAYSAGLEKLEKWHEENCKGQATK